LAAAIDGAWISLFGAIGSGVGLIASTAAAAITGCISIVVVVAIITILEGGKRRATPGKALLQLAVADQATQLPIGRTRALLRVLGFALSGALLYLPLLGALRRPSRQTWYDLRTRSVVLSSSPGL
jgi:uncharacterized RDD family membrane protein YckC